MKRIATDIGGTFTDLVTFDEEDVENWPAVKNKFLSVKDSLELFNKFF